MCFHYTELHGGKSTMPRSVATGTSIAGSQRLGESHTQGLHCDYMYTKCNSSYTHYFMVHTRDPAHLTHISHVYMYICMLTML